MVLESLSVWPVLRWCSVDVVVKGVLSGTVTCKKPGLHMRGSAHRPGPGHLIRVPIKDLNTALSSPLLVFGGGHRNASMTTSVQSPWVFKACTVVVAST